MIVKQDEEKQVKRAHRNPNPVSPFDRIEAIFGQQYIQKRFFEALDKAKDVKTTLLIENYRQIKNENLKLVGDPITSVTFTCKVVCLKKTNYPTIKFRLDQHLHQLKKIFGPQQDQYDQTSVPLDLHRLAACAATNWNTSLMSQHAIHRCHKKECFNPFHLYFGTVDQNRSTDFCPAYANINGTLVNICSHDPKCLIHGARSVHHH